MLHPDGELSKKHEQFQRRWFTLAGLLEGTSRPDGFFDAELTNMLRAALDPLARPAGADDTRTTGQRYADALYTLLPGRRPYVGGLVLCEIAALRYRVLHVALRLIRSACRLRLRLRIDATWRRATHATTAFHPLRTAFS